MQLKAALLCLTDEFNQIVLEFTDVEGEIQYINATGLQCADFNFTRKVVPFSRLG